MILGPRKNQERIFSRPIDFFSLIRTNRRMQSVSLTSYLPIFFFISRRKQMFLLCLRGILRHIFSSPLMPAFSRSVSPITNEKLACTVRLEGGKGKQGKYSWRHFASFLTNTHFFLISWATHAMLLSALLIAQPYWERRERRKRRGKV